MKPYKGANQSRFLRQYLIFSLPGLVPYGQGPQREFVFRGESIQDTDNRGGSITIDVSLSFSNRREAIEWARALLEAAESSPPSQMGRKRERGL